MQRSIAGAWSRYEAHVTVHAPADVVKRRLPFDASGIEPLDDARCTYRASDENLEWLAIRIAMLGADVEVHEPPELVAQLGQLGERLLRAAQIGGVP